MHEQILIGLASVIVLGIAAQWVAWRLRFPAILLLLGTGLLAGPVTGLLDPDKLFGDLLLPIIPAAVALILYEGGLSLKIKELPSVGRVVLSLVTIGALVTWVLSAIAAHYLFSLGWSLSVLLGAILIVTGPTVIQPLLREIRPRGAVGPILKWEGIVIDPIGALLAVLVFEVVHSGGITTAPAHTGMILAKTAVAGGGMGFAAGLWLAFLVKKFWVPDFLQNPVSLAMVIAVFVASNAVQHESGLFAVTVMGIVLANQKFTDVTHIIEFKENLRVLLISTLFIVLAARLKPEHFQVMGWSSVVFVAVLVLAVRPLAVWVSTLRSQLERRERVFLSCMAPRGIVAAAVASVFAVRLEHAGYEQAGLLVPATFVVIISTVLIYSIGAPIAARRLGVADLHSQGLLIVGGQTWARAIAKLLKEKGYRVLLIDSNRANINAARMQGLETYFGNVLADYAIDEMDLGGIGSLLAMTPNSSVNTLAVHRFERILGRADVYRLAATADSSAKGKNGQGHSEGRILFNASATFEHLSNLFKQGATVKATPLTETFDYDAFRQRYGESAIPLFAIDEEKDLTVLAADEKSLIKPGHVLIALVHNQEDDESA